MIPSRHVCVVGLGYIGLPTASLLASKGFRVTGVDVNPRVLEAVGAGGIHIREPELDILVKSAVQSGRLSVSDRPARADIFLLAVPTPITDRRKPDLEYVRNAVESICPYLEDGNLVILESTCPVGTTEQIVDCIGRLRPDLALPVCDNQTGTTGAGVHVAYCPERVLPGRIIHEMVDNDRIVGGVDLPSTAAAASFYRSFVAGAVLTTDCRTAEMAKLAENTFRDVNIAFANELSLICEHLGIDVWQLIELTNRHPRVNILRPGPGVGGHCIAVDPWFLVDAAPEQAQLIQTARRVNIAKQQRVVNQVLAALDTLAAPTVACFGLTYKADVDDLRQSPALDITLQIARSRRARVLVVDPFVDRLPPHFDGLDAELMPALDALDAADACVALVPHRAFQALPRAALAGKIVVDACGLWS